MRGNKSLAYSIREEAGVKLTDILSVFYAKGIEDNHAEEVIHRFVSEGLLDIIKISEENESYALLLKGAKLADQEENEEKAVCLRFFDALKENKTVRIFHVTGIDGIEGAGDGFRLIGEPWGLGSIFPYKRVFTKYELTLVSNCINIQVQGGYLKKNYMDLFGAVSQGGGQQVQAALETPGNLRWTRA